MSFRAYLTGGAEMASSEVNDLLAKARRGDSNALGCLLQRYGPYLKLLAQRRLDQRLQARIDPADVVQQTFLEAQRDLAQFRGRTESELMAWLRTILDHNIAQVVQKHLLAQKRDATRERSLNDSRQGGGPLASRLPAEQSSPSQRAMRGESAVRLALAMSALPEAQQEAIRLRHLEGLSLAEIGQRMQRSELAVAGLLKRGLRGLRTQLEEMQD